MRKLWITNLISITIVRYLKFIALLATMFVAVACVNNELDFDGGHNDADVSVISVYGNVARFADCEVSTRANKTPEESYVSSMALAVFPINDGTIGDCIHYELRDGSNLLYTVDRAEIRKKYDNDYDNASCVMYIFANMPNLPGNGYEGSLDDLMNLALSAPGVTRPEAGFPMIGSLGDENRDGKEFVLIPMTGNRMDLPKVNGSPTDYLNIPMSAIFAKISFEITVSAEQDVDNNDPARFEMTGYEIHNLPSAVSFNENKNKENVQSVSSEPVEIAMAGIAQGGDEGSGSTIAFDFYLPERLLTPEKPAEEYEYPLGEKGAKVEGYSSIPAKNKRYAQRYKPELLGEDQKATYVTIKGKYRDHQEEYYTVAYNIYLGADNYGDFNIKRNDQYFNKLNIKGITSSDDQSLNSDAISIDHRVNVERSSPLIVSIRRETQLDAHYEVRPLRLRIAGDEVPNGARAVVEVLNENGTTTNRPAWVRLEKSGNTTNHITDGTYSAGKRKYFTTNLVTSTLAANTSVEVTDLKTSGNSTVWIYVDEADVTNATPSRSTRSAMIRVTYYEGDEVKDEKDYTITQYNLHKITGAVSNSDYYIECYEEYLYNYDSEEPYGQIREEGMPWGLDGVQLSNTDKSFSSSGGDFGSTIQNWITSEARPYYDFYNTKHDKSYTTSGTFHDYAGQSFTSGIYTKSSGNVEILTMAQQADGAVEYCYNRNKRNSDGSIAKVEWYLPAADELEDFIIAAYNYYHEFQDNYYWTSQPAYIRNLFYYEGSLTGISYGPMFIDNVNYARATKVDNNLQYIESGLVKEYAGIRDNSGDRVNVGYYYQMYSKKNLGSLEILSNDQQWQVKTGGSLFNPTYTYYYAHMGHLYDLKQDGYRHRNESHRVRCAYKKAN